MSRDWEEDRDEDRGPRRARVAPPPPRADDALVRQAEVFTKALATQQAELVGVLQAALEQQHRLVEQVLDRQLALISPDALRLSATLARNRASAGRPDSGPPQSPRPHPVEARGFDEADARGVPLSELEDEINGMI